MTFMIAAAGTGGHVYPGLAVGEALVHRGVQMDHVTFVGGDRLEAVVYPGKGFDFVEVELAGLQRRLTLRNARIPGVVLAARREISQQIDIRGIRVVLAMGGYVTIPAGLAARSQRVPFFNAEQNASAGLANRASARWARASFVSFPETAGLAHGRWVGNPVRQFLWAFDRASLHDEAMRRYDLSPRVPTLGVFGGSLGAAVVNEMVASMLETWAWGPVQVVHLTGDDHVELMNERTATADVVWRRTGLEDRMDLFFAACDLVIARAGGAVAELTATSTPSVLIPGSFGSGGHQEENAAAMERSGASVVVAEADGHELAGTVQEILGDRSRLDDMATAASAISKPGAALTIADAMIEAAK